MKKKNPLWNIPPPLRRGFVPGMKKGAILFMATSLLFLGCRRELSVTGEQAGPGKTTGSANAEAAGDFTIVVIPDTQYYTDPGSGHGGTEAMFQAQVNWIKANRVAENIAYVAHVGDITDDGDNDPQQWVRASRVLYSLETPLPELPYGIPYGLAVGNHDQAPSWGNPNAALARYNQYFGRSHFAGRAYYGGNKAGTGSNNNDCHFDLFTAGGIDFIVIYLEFDGNGGSWNDMNEWAKNLLITYSNRKGIIVTHNLMNAGIGTAFNPQGAAIHHRMKYRTNTFLMLSGHTGPNGRRADTYNNNTINTIMQDYQNQANGGNGYLRLLKISVANNTISARTYSPYLNAWASATDNNVTFTLPLFTTPVTPPVSLTPVADTYIRDGSYADQNFGAATGMVVKSGAAGFTRKAYLKFDVSGIGSVSDAQLRVYGSNTESTAAAGMRILSVADDSWSENGITWNNAPAVSYMGYRTVNNTRQHYDFNVTSYVQSQVAGDKTVSLCIEQASGTNLTCTFNSKENEFYQPQLRIKE